MRVYIAGPMTSRPDWNRAGFAFVAAELAAKGYTVINPHDLHPPPPPWHPGIEHEPGFADLHRRYLLEDAGHLLRCDRVFALPGWRHSPGARKEIALAFLFGIPVEEWPTGHVLPCDQETARLGLLCLLEVADIVGANSASHGGHVEWHSRTPQYHAHKVAGHAVTAAAQLAGERAPEHGEGAREHLQRCLVRSAMALSRLDSLSPPPSEICNLKS